MIGEKMGEKQKTNMTIGPAGLAKKTAQSTESITPASASKLKFLVNRILRFDNDPTVQAAIIIWAHIKTSMC